LVVIETAQSGFARAAVPDREAQARELAERIQTLRASGLFEYVEPDRYLELKAVPTDPYLANGTLWGMRNTTGLRGVDAGAEAAWGVTAGSSNVVVAVIDSGIDTKHPDLVANLWRNPRETPGNQRDDDGNGYVDDVHGIDLVASQSGVALSADANGHGTHVSGTIAAAANNIGVVGLAHGVRLMGIRTYDENGRGGSVSSLIKGLEYAVLQGARVINASFGGPVYSQAASDAYSAAGAAGVLVVCSAGNDSQNNDSEPSYPANYRLANLLSVASVNQAGELSAFSNYGLDSVDIGAPGEDIVSTYPGNAYIFLNGTSMAAPHVAAVAALVISRYPGIGLPELRQRLIQSSVPLPALAGKVKTGGIVNAYRALALNPDGNPEFTLRPAKGHFIAGRSAEVEVLSTDVSPLTGGELEMSIASSAPALLRDDGLPPDRQAADGIYTGAVLPQAFGDQQATLRLLHRGRDWERKLPVFVEKPAENDFFSNRTTLIPGAAEVSGSTYGAGVEALEPQLQGRNGAATVWYRYTPTTSGPNGLLAFGGDFEPTLRIYSGTSLASLKVWTNGLTTEREGALSRAVFTAQAGVPLAISLSSDQGAQGNFKLGLFDAQNIPRPAGDNRSNPNYISTSRSFDLEADSTFATRETGEPSHAGSTGGHSVWWRYVSPVDGLLVIDTFGSDFDTVLAAYRTGSSVALAANDDARSLDGVLRTSSRITVSVIKDTPIDIAVDGWRGGSGKIVLQGSLTPGFNDLYDQPHQLSTGTLKTGSNNGATKGLGEKDHASDRGGASVWYEWRAPVGGRATVTVTPWNASTFSPRVAVYVGPEDIRELADWDKVKLVSFSLNGTVSFQAMSGQTYRIAVDGRYYQSCFLWCVDKVEQGDFNIVLNQQGELSQLVSTGYELNNDAELTSIGDGVSAESLASYWTAALSGQYSRRFSAAGAPAFHGYTNAVELGGGRLQLTCKFSHSGGGGSDSGWGFGFFVLPIGYSADADALSENAKLLFFAFDSNGTEAGLLSGAFSGDTTTVPIPGLGVVAGQKHTLTLGVDLPSQTFEITLDGRPPVQMPVSLFGRANLAMGPFVLSTPATLPYPTLLLDDLDVRVFPRGLGSPPPPSLGKPEVAFGTGRITLPLDAPANVAWILESSTDLTVWIEVKRGTASGQTTEIDAGPPPASGPLFWRVRTP
jgi:subtilisin family serine protease